MPYRQDDPLSAQSPAAPRWVDAALAWPGPVAIGLAAMILTPMSLTWTGRPWLAMVLLAGAALFWWTVMWIGRHVCVPGFCILVAAMILLAAAAARPISRDPVGFFRLSATWDGANESAAASAFMLDREYALVATQKLVVALLLAIPLSAAVWLKGWTQRWFRLALLAGVAGLLVLTMLQMVRGKAGPPDALDRAALATFTPMPAQHVAAMLAGLAAWLLGTMLGDLRARATELHADSQFPPDAGEQHDRPASPHVPLALLSGMLLAATVAALVATMTAGEVIWAPWRETAPWLAIAAGLTLLLVPRRWAFRASGGALLLLGMVAIALAWPGRMVSRSFTRGGLFGWAGADLHDTAFPGLLWLIEWRGLLGAAAALAAIAIAGIAQLRALGRHSSSAERLAAGGAAAGMWTIVLGWLLGPGYISGAAAFVALLLWAFSLGPQGLPPGRRPLAFMLALLAVVVAVYGLIGMAPMVHEPLWIPAVGQTYDKLLHGVWGLYVTLVCCLGLAPLGRWPAVLGGTVLSLALAAGAEFVQPVIGRTFDWADIVAYAIAASIVASALLAVPYHWPMWRRDDRCG